VDINMAIAAEKRRKASAKQTEKTQQKRAAAVKNAASCMRQTTLFGR
jgi:hypothetical protein